MDNLISKVAKGPRDLNRIKELSFLINFDKMDKSRYALMRRRGGSLYLRGLEYPTMERACFNNRWNGWVELLNQPLDPVSIINKARIIAEVQADVLLLQEIEDRSSLEDFNEKFLKEYPGTNYAHITLLPSSPSQGAENALLLKKGFQVSKLYVYSEEKRGDGRFLFDKGCAVFEVNCPGSLQIALLTTQFSPEELPKDKADAFRLQQTLRIIEIYRELRSEGMKNIIIMGTLNAYSYCHSLSPLFQQTDLKDICKHPEFHKECDTRNSKYHRLGGYGKGINIRQKDYFLVSPELYDRIEKTSINRKAMWPGDDPQWIVYRTIKERKNQASEHPLLWMDIQT